MFETDLSAPRGQARVIRVDRARYHVVDSHGDDFQMTTTPAVARLQIAVGDYLHWGENETPALQPRETELSRSTNTHPFRQVLAANVHLVLLALPAPAGARPHVVERLAALGWASGAEPRFLITKSDLVTDSDLDAIATSLAQLGPGIPATFTSSESTSGIHGLAELIATAGTAVIIGHSGVGKSSIVNALMGTTDQVVGVTRSRDMKGRHTTSHRELITLPRGGCLIDTPGVRELGMDIERSDLERVFVEIADFAANCRFSDCTHRSEPGCAVLAAIDAGELETDRVQSMRHLEREMKHAESKREPQRRDKDREWNRKSREYRRARGH